MSLSGLPPTAVPPKQTDRTNAPIKTPSPPSKWHLSPQALHATGCACLHPARHLMTSPQMLHYMLRRLCKAWRRLINDFHADLPPAVMTAGERVWLALFSKGYDLFHLAARHVRTGPGQRTVLAILFLVPSPEDEAGSGHRWVAEMQVQMHERRGVECVSVRYREDPEDWTASDGREYFKDEAGTGGVVWLENGRTIGDEMVLRELEEGAVRLLDGATPSKGDLRGKIGRAAKEFRMDGMDVCGVEVERVYRRGEPGGEALVPVVRIGMVVNKDGELGATVIIDTVGKEGKQRRANDIAVMYQGEWPITHHYRTAIAAPSLNGLSALIR